MGPHGKGGETWRVSGCLVQDIISQPAAHSPGSRDGPGLPAPAPGEAPCSLPAVTRPPLPCPGTCPLSIPRAGPRWAGMP